MKQCKAKIISNEKIAADCYRIRLKTPSISKKARPGNFLMVKCSDGPTPFLRRALAFHSIKKDYFDILYQVVGPGTKALSLRKKGEMVDVIGPLGNSFSSTLKGHRRQDIIMVAGGIGVAPLLAQAERLMATKKDEKIKIIIGGCTKKHILCEKDFKDLGVEVRVVTEDGSRGKRGMATDLLKDELRAVSANIGRIVYACGPKAMLRAVAKISREKNVFCEVSLEEKMACGTGACLGCAVNTILGMRMVCKDGPVFNSGDIVWQS